MNFYILNSIINFWIRVFAIELYQDLIEKNDYTKPVVNLTEYHHIVPKAHGGLDIPSNMIHLYHKDHFKAHYYLWLIHQTDKTAYALIMMYKRCKVENIILEEIEDYADEFQKLKEKFRAGFYKRIMIDGKIRRIKLENLPLDYYSNPEKYKIENIAYTKGMKYININGKNTFLIEE